MKKKTRLLFLWRCSFHFSSLPAALCLKSNLNIKTSTWSLTSPPPPHSLQLQTADIWLCVFSQGNCKQHKCLRLCFISGVPPWRICHCVLNMYVCVCICMCVSVCALAAILLLVTSNASLGCIRAEIAFWVLYVCMGDFVEFESMFIHYSEVLVNGHVLIRVHVAVFSTGTVHMTHISKTINAAWVLNAIIITHWLGCWDLYQKFTGIQKEWVCGSRYMSKWLAINLIIGS